MADTVRTRRQDADEAKARLLIEAEDLATQAEDLYALIADHVAGAIDDVDLTARAALLAPSPRGQEPVRAQTGTPWMAERSIALGALIAELVGTTPAVEKWRAANLPRGLLAEADVAPWVRARFWEERPPVGMILDPFVTPKPAAWWIRPRGRGPRPKGARRVEWIKGDRYEAPNFSVAALSGRAEAVARYYPKAMRCDPIRNTAAYSPETVGLDCGVRVGNLGALSVLQVPEGGSLGALAKLSAAIAKRWRIEPGAATLAVLVGAPPAYSPLNGHVAFGSVFGFTHRVELSIDPMVTPQEVATFYQSLRSLLGSSKARANKRQPIKIRWLRVAAHRASVHTLSAAEAWRAWQTSHPEEPRSDYRTYWRQTTETRRRLLRGMDIGLDWPDWVDGDPIDELAPHGRGGGRDPALHPRDRTRGPK